MSTSGHAIHGDTLQRTLEHQRMPPNGASFLLWNMIGITHGHLNVHCSGFSLQYPAREVEEAVPGSRPLSFGSCHDMSLQDRAFRRVK